MPTKQTLPPRQCDYEPCGATFTPRRRWQRFCCDEHKKLYHKQAQERLESLTRRYVAAVDAFERAPTDEAAIELAQAKRALWGETR